MFSCFYLIREMFQTVTQLVLDVDHTGLDPLTFYLLIRLRNGIVGNRMLPYMDVDLWWMHSSRQNSAWIVTLLTAWPTIFLNIIATPNLRRNVNVQVIVRFWWFTESCDVYLEEDEPSHLSAQIIEMYRLCAAVLQKWVNVYRGSCVKRRLFVNSANNLTYGNTD